MAEVNIYAQALGAAIRVRRDARKLTQRQMAEVVGIQQSTFNKIELGQRIPTTEQATEIAKFFEYELTELHLLYPDRYPAPQAPAQASENAA